MKENSKVPSIRQVSSRLGVDAMAIYHYFSNKASLLEAVTTSLMEGIYEPTGNGDWKGEMARLSRSYLELLRSHPGLLETFLSMTSYGPAELFSDRLVTALAPLNLTQPKLEQIRNLLADYLHGVALAMQYNPDSLDMDCIDDSMGLIIGAIESSHRTNAGASPSP
ncbi:TetR/AcrR family transcriptional regulator [Microbulbifer sp. 2201CG32-9]|uniref:TetR/AcrR family transcriptional regulator n=1 Tax=Microbulbifer sp. 2201CG32-9 TaxID=3232309 RepID=UPI00345C0BB6